MSGPAILVMWWRDIATLHYRADANVLAALLPAGIELDRFAGEAWLSVVPFRMNDVGVRGTPVLPGFANVPEINLRTYVRSGGRPGIFFFSLDASEPLVVRAANVMTGLPYRDARIATGERDGVISYTSERIDRRTLAGRFRASYSPRGEAKLARAGTLECFLHERYRFFVRRGTTIFTGEVRHGPWPLQALDVEVRENTLGTLAHHELQIQPDRAFFARELHVRATAVLPLRARASERSLD